MRTRNTTVQQHREQIADLILLDPEGNPLVVSSAIENREGWMTFEVQQPRQGGDRYRVTLKIEEIF